MGRAWPVRCRTTSARLPEQRLADAGAGRGDPLHRGERRGPPREGNAHGELPRPRAAQRPVSRDSQRSGLAADRVTRRTYTAALMAAEPTSAAVGVSPLELGCRSRRPKGTAGPGPTPAPPIP